jgi:hypothetical protein
MTLLVEQGAPGSPFVHQVWPGLSVPPAPVVMVRLQPERRRAMRT